jgi:hypothetical protein
MMQNNDSKYENVQQAASRTRKSFFNFGNWHNFLSNRFPWNDWYLLYYFCESWKWW